MGANGRNWPGVIGFADRCVTTLQRGRDFGGSLSLRPERRPCYIGGAMTRQCRETLRFGPQSRRSSQASPFANGDKMDYALARQAMVDRQVRPHDVNDLRVLGSLLEVPRERFLDARHRPLAYL